MADSQIEATPHFRPRSATARDGIAVIYDLSEFTKFFTAADAHRYVPAFINRVAAAITICINGGESYWERPERTISPLDLPLVHRKFLGDGELLIFEALDNVASGIPSLLARFWNLQAFFENLRKAALEEVPVLGTPPNIKFGIARGDIYELYREGNEAQSEFIGVSVNLASRLVKYCPKLSFIASHRVGLSRNLREHYDFLMIATTKLRGFEGEIVFVDKTEFENLPSELKAELFAELV